MNQRLPILDQIDIADELAAGRWKVIFYRHNCSKCEVLLADCQASNGREFDERQLAVAAVELPPYGHGEVLTDETAFRRGRLSDAREWFVTTPLVVRLRDGVVANVEMP